MTMMAGFNTDDLLHNANKYYENNRPLEAANLINRYASQNSSKRIGQFSAGVVLDLHRPKAMVHLAEYLLHTKIFQNTTIIKRNLNLDSVVDGVHCIDATKFYDLRYLERPLFTIDEIEQNCGLNNIWHWICNDKQLYYSASKSRYFDPKSPFTQEKLELLIRVVYTNLYQFITNSSPELILSLDLVRLWHVTMHEVAASQGIPRAYLLPTRVKNYLAFSPSPFEQFEYAKTWAKNVDDSKAPEQYLDQAKNYVNQHIEETREFHDSAQLSDGSRVSNELRISNVARQWIDSLLTTVSTKSEQSTTILEYRSSPSRFHEPIELTKTLVRKYFQSQKYANVNKNEENKILFALHSEPETALSLYAPHLPLQPSTVDVLARSLPFDSTLYVKDHPRMANLRSRQYYQQMCDRNPNVKLLPTHADVLGYIDNMDLIVTAAGTVGIEALMFKKPVVTLGSCHYQHLYGVTPVRDLSSLHSVTETVLNREWDNSKMQKQVTEYIAGCMAEGYPIGWWSDIDETYDYTSSEFNGFCEFVRENLEQVIVDDEWEVPLNYGYIL